MVKNEPFSIRQMIELTGLSEFTIRGWENRYAAFEPRRSETGRREYSKHDVERALLLRELLKRGHKIGKLAKLNNRKLHGLFEEFQGDRKPEKQMQNSDLAIQAMELMALQKWPELSTLFKRVQCKTPGDLVKDFFLPLLMELAAQVRSGLVSVAQEHVISSLIKEKIYSALSTLSDSKLKRVSQSKIRFVLATPEGDYHEIGLLLAHLLIRSRGFTSLYLGPHTPAQDISETALRFEASHLLIVSNVSKKQGARQEILTYVSDVQKKIGSNLEILLAGSQAPLIQLDPSSSLWSVSNFYDFESYLDTLKIKIPI